MKVIDLAKELNLKSGRLLDILKTLGYNEITHHMHNIPDNDVELIRKNLDSGEVDSSDRVAFGINTPAANPFSVLVLKYSGGDFTEKISNISKELNITSEKLLEVLNKFGYPVLQTEYTEGTRYKSHAIMEFKKYVGNSSIFDEEERILPENK